MHAFPSLFAFDPAHNIIDSYEHKVHDNRLAEYGGAKFFYDAFGNTVHKEFVNGETQNLYYDVFHQLVKVETLKHNPETGEWVKETWLFDYDALGRRISKGRLKNGRQVSDSLEEVTEFIWSGSRLVQEVNGNGRYTYIHTDQDSYEPLAQIHSYTDTEGESRQEINYFHCDQIGIPREMTDRDGNLIWFGEYDAWGKLTKETNVTGRAHQPFRLQNQYYDKETGLHYNFFRYYDPLVGRFTQQDPIGLAGGDNLYRFAPNGQGWIDALGLEMDLPSLPNDFVTTLAAYGDGLTFGATRYLRNALDIGSVDENSELYTQGSLIGSTVTSVLGTSRLAIKANEFSLKRLGYGIAKDRPHKGMGPHLHYGKCYPNSQHPRNHFGPKNPLHGSKNFNWKDWWKNGRPWRWK